MKISKKKKAWYQFIFAVALICCGFGSLQVWASSSGYSGCSSDILDMVTVRSQLKDLLRKLEWSILNFLATVIDYFDSAIKTLLKRHCRRHLRRCSWRYDRTVQGWKGCWRSCHRRCRWSSRRFVRTL